MSKIFYDYLIDLDEVEKKIKKSTSSKEEREELWQIVDEIVNHRVMGVILEKLPKEKHIEFLEMFSSYPHDEGIVNYLQGNIKENFEGIIKEELGDLAYEILKDLNLK